MKETINNEEELFEMLDSFLREPGDFWTDFYRDREKKIPFFKNVPDENLVSYLSKGSLTSGKALELGCGPGRNAIHLARNGWEVDAVDISETSLQWAKERAEGSGVSINFIHNNIFSLDLDEGGYDLVYDSGCFHHIAPHRRLSYVQLVNKALKPGGHFALTTFIKGGKLGGSIISDWEVYRTGSLQGGLGYDKTRLENIFSDFESLEIRNMKDQDDSGEMFGTSELLAALFRKK
ncbi:bifunctional 2-polyprenyl-6-hydroxyphenol methylase/3-demethylubiquinol 3-O-methyltransferase UbiG [Bacillus sp. Marseille-Q1617]|uniref:class I SAM-dependent methyltransferase n=1 Tax=Bacillus sp. Marseille-Q1617 TaxID=2736887 RepID=UPI00158B33D5|nr:class I SAM-dependent methyltransferase [Bacillus sp. Marseille-Q1617]